MAIISKTNKVPSIYDLTPYKAAAIDITSGKPSSVVAPPVTSLLKEGIKRQLQIVDEQNAINRFVWYNLPGDLDGQLLERILYYRGQGMFFYIDELRQFFFLPYALDGSIDIYGRFTGVNPLPFNGSTTSDDKESKTWIENFKRKPIYKVLTETPTKEQFMDGCVLLSDYSKQISQINTARKDINEPILDIMSSCIPYLRTALQNGTGVSGLRVGSDDESAQAQAASLSVEDAALNAKKYIPIVSGVDFQDLNNSTPAKAEEYLLTMQSLDNYRLGLYGLENGGLFRKKAQMLQSEQAMAGENASVGLVMQDSLTLRQNFCDIVNSIWGLGIWCDISENAVAADRNMDGIMGDEQMPMEGNQNEYEHDEQ